MIITRFHNQIQRTIDVEFLTPTYLGGADLHSELRSAPFKALFRQYWRIANGHVTVEELHQKEGELFGSATDDNNQGSSLFRLSISQTTLNLATIKRNSIGRIGKQGVCALTYLAYGKQDYQYIEPNQSLSLHLSYPQKYQEDIEKTLRLIQAYGAIGGKTRNGFGSIWLTENGKTLPALFTTQTKSWETVFTKKEFPHFAQKQLVWQYQGSDKILNWKRAMFFLAERYLSIRKSFGKEPLLQSNHQSPSEKHILGMPIVQMRVNMAGWNATNVRMPSQVRLLVKKDANNHLVARIAQLPHAIALPDIPKDIQQKMWQKLHQILNRDHNWRRL